MDSAECIRAIFGLLLATYGPQGWWPLLDVQGTNPTASGNLHGYHPGEYDFPRTAAQRFEICVGAVLTQNTAWPNVEQALRRLHATAALSADAILALPQADLEVAIRSSGYFRAKARKLCELSTFWKRLQGRTPERAELLDVRGIGPETADSILLYAFGQPEMVVDTYTIRVLTALGVVRGGAGYGEVKALCVRALPRRVAVYQEFHALMVEHVKHCYRRRPWRDPLLAPIAANQAPCDPEVATASFAHQKRQPRPPCGGRGCVGWLSA